VILRGDEIYFFSGVQKWEKEKDIFSKKEFQPFPNSFSRKLKFF